MEKEWPIYETSLEILSKWKPTSYQILVKLRLKLHLSFITISIDVRNAIQVTDGEYSYGRAKKELVKGQICWNIGYGPQRTHLEMAKTETITDRNGH